MEEDNLFKKLSNGFQQAENRKKSIQRQTSCLSQNLTQSESYLNVHCKALKLLEDNTGENLCDLGFDEEFLDMTPENHNP